MVNLGPKSNSCAVTLIILVIQYSFSVAYFLKEEKVGAVSFHYAIGLSYCSLNIISLFSLTGTEFGITANR